MLSFYTWEISRTLTCIVAERNPTWMRSFPVISGRRNYTNLYWSFFFLPAICVLLDRIGPFALVPSSGRVFLLLNLLKIWYPLDDLGYALDHSLGRLVFAIENWNDFFVVYPLAVFSRQLNAIMALDKNVLSSKSTLRKRRIVLPPELLHLVSFYFSIDEVKSLRYERNPLTDQLDL
jgi:hypothetical protein